MKIYFSPYFLTKKNTAERQEGVLVKYVEGDYWGVADLCPHLNLGDATCKQEIKAEGSLFQRALELAQEDLQARKEKTSLLFDKSVANNYLVTDLKNYNFNKSFFVGRTLKLKAGQDIKTLAEQLNAINIDCKIRLDFNSKLSSVEFDSFLNLLTAAAKNKIQYIEDPTKDTTEWKKWNSIISLASDFIKVDAKSGAAKFKIFKPSRENIDSDWQESIFTSAMDHPVGLAHGLRIAQQKSKYESGFLTLDLYEANSFYKYFIQDGHLLNFSIEALQDYGIGMTEELQKISWIEKDRLSL